MESLWRYLVELFTSADRVTLLQFYSAAAIFLILILLLIRHGRGLRIASQASSRVADLDRKLSSLGSTVDRLEGEVGGELEARVQARVESRFDALEKRVQELHSRQSDLLEERVSELGGRISQARAEVKALERRLSEVEDRMPGLFDGLGEFKKALAKGYQSELSSMLGSFDNAVKALLSQMKDELRGSLSRIEGIESMIRGRRSAEEDVGAVDVAAVEPRRPAGEEVAEAPGPQLGEQDPEGLSLDGAERRSGQGDEEETDGAEGLV